MRIDSSMRNSQLKSDIERFPAKGKSIFKTAHLFFV